MNGELVQISRLRAGIGRRMTESKQSVPHFYVEVEVELDDVFAVRSELRDEGHELSVTAFLVAAAAHALSLNPGLNAVWTEDGLFRADEINVAVAVALDDGLLAPVLANAGSLTVIEIGERVADLVERTRAGRLRVPELTDGTFTVSNLGMFPVSAFTAIITAPQVAVLASGRPREVVRLRDGGPVATRVMTATLSADHRAVDGADAARFVDSFKTALETPRSLLTPAQTNKEVAT